MTINNKFSFECAVQSLARVLAQIKPTPWEKVSVFLSLFNSYFLSNLSFSFGKSINRFRIASTKILMKSRELG